MSKPWCADLPADPAIRRILVIKWSAMGDVIIASALFDDIARAFPGREIHLNTSPAWQGLFAEDPRFQRVFAVEWRARGRRIRGLLDWLRQVRAQRYDLVIDLQCNDRSRLLLGLLGLIGGRIRRRLGNRRQWPYTIAPAELPPPVHTITRCRAALEAGGIAATTPRPVLPMAESRRSCVLTLMQQHDLRSGRYAVFFAWLQCERLFEAVGADRYAALANQLRQEGVEQITVIGGPDEVEECQRIARQCGPWLVNLCGQTAILDIPLLCAAAQFIVANDTGTAHLAAVASTPMLVLCGPTDPRRVKPLGDNVITLQADLPCVNCYRKTCSHHSCMTMLTPARVLQQVRRLRAS